MIKKLKSAFTLIEILIVISVIVILTGTSLFVVSNPTRNAQNNFDSAVDGIYNLLVNLRSYNINSFIWNGAHGNDCGPPNSLYGYTLWISCTQTMTVYAYCSNHTTGTDLQLSAANLPQHVYMSTSLNTNADAYNNTCFNRKEQIKFDLATGKQASRNHTNGGDTYFNPVFTSTPIDLIFWDDDSFGSQRLCQRISIDQNGIISKGPKYWGVYGGYPPGGCQNAPTPTPTPTPLPVG